MGNNDRTMFGAFKASSVCSGVLLWKSPWRMSATRKANVRKRLKAVDSVIEVLRSTGIQTAALDKALLLPKEHEMRPKDKTQGAQVHKVDITGEPQGILGPTSACTSPMLFLVESLRRFDDPRPFSLRQSSYSTLDTTVQHTLHRATADTSFRVVKQIRLPLQQLSTSLASGCLPSTCR